MKKNILILIVLFLSGLLFAEGEKTAESIPYYRKEFLAKLGISRDALGKTGIWQLDVEKAATQTGLKKIYECASRATDACTEASYFRIRKNEKYIVIERCYSLETEAREFRLYLFLDSLGAFTKAGLTEAIIKNEPK